MIPKFGRNDLLPPGEHEASWAEVKKRFGTNPQRRELLEGLREMCLVVRLAGIKRLFLDGSFVTRKNIPGDYDCYYLNEGDVMNRLNELDEVLLDFSNERLAMKAKYKGEIWPHDWFGIRPQLIKDFFQEDKHTHEPKGIIVLDVESVS